MSKKLDTFQIDIPCKDCPMMPVCSTYPILDKVMQTRKCVNQINILDGGDSTKTHRVPISNSNNIIINLYLMCSYKSSENSIHTLGNENHNFSCSIPCVDCTFSKNCKYGPSYLSLPDLKDAYDFHFKNYGCDKCVHIFNIDSLSYFLSVHCNCKGGLTHDST